VERLTHADDRRHTVEQVLGLLFSTSSAKPRVPGGRRPAFERDLTEAPRALAPHGVRTRHLVTEAVIAWRH
jgi:hypothetical protein